MLIGEVKMLERSFGGCYLAKKIRQKKYSWYSSHIFISPNTCEHDNFVCSSSVKINVPFTLTCLMCSPSFPCSFLLNWLFLCSLKLVYAFGKCYCVYVASTGTNACRLKGHHWSVLCTPAVPRDQCAGRCEHTEQTSEPGSLGEF